MTAPLDRLCQPTLVDGTVAGDPAWHHFAPVGDETAKQALIFVIDMLDLVFAESADFPAFPLGKISFARISISIIAFSTHVWFHISPFALQLVI